MKQIRQCSHCGFFGHEEEYYEHSCPDKYTDNEYETELYTEEEDVRCKKCGSLLTADQLDCLNCGLSTRTISEEYARGYEDAIVDFKKAIKEHLSDSEEFNLNSFKMFLGV